MKTKAMTLIAFVFIVSVSVLRATYFPEADIFWGARNGMDTLHGGVHIFQPDTWNLQTLGEEWSPNSWLWNVLLGGSYLLFGNYGFLLLTLVVNVAAFSFLWGYLQKLRITPLTAFLCLVGCWVVMLMFMNGRSNTGDFLILTLFLYLCRHLLQKMVPLLITSFLLTVLWMNLHMTGIAACLVFPAVAYAMMHKEVIRRRLIRSFLVFLSVIVALPLTPYGLKGLLKVSMVENESKDIITEWSNVFALPHANGGILFLLAVSVVCCVFVFKQKEWLYGLLTVALIYGTYDTIRLTPFLLTIVMAALVFWEDSYSQPLVVSPRWSDVPKLVLRMLMVAALLVSIVSGASLIRVAKHSESMFAVTTAELSLIPANARAAVTQDAGSAIILFRPDVLVTLDGRNDLIGKDRFIEAASILYSEDSSAISEWLGKNAIDTVFIEDRGAVGTERIRSNMQALGWDVRTNETKAVVYVKP